MYTLLANLPGHTRNKWPKHVLSARKRKLREPNQVNFIEL